VGKGTRGDVVINIKRFGDRSSTHQLPILFFLWIENAFYRERKSLYQLDLGLGTTGTLLRCQEPRKECQFIDMGDAVAYKEKPIPAKKL